MAECWCGAVLVPSARGNVRQFCSDAHRKAHARAGGDVALLSRFISRRCLECGVAVPARGSRLRCGSTDCETARKARYEKAESERASREFLEFLDREGVDVEGFSLDAPPESARLTSYPTPGCDLDPLAFPGEGWDAQAFVDEFGRSGWEVGQTYDRPLNKTLGDPVRPARV